MCKLKPFFLIIFLIFCCCNKAPNYKLNGTWLIDEIYVEDKSYKEFLHVNVMSFDSKNKTCTFPGSSYEEGDRNASYEVKGDSIIIKSNNHIINRSFKISQDNQNMLLRSRDIVIKTKIAFRH